MFPVGHLSPCRALYSVSSFHPLCQELPQCGSHTCPQQASGMGSRTSGVSAYLHAVSLHSSAGTHTHGLCCSNGVLWPMRSAAQGIQGTTRAAPSSGPYLRLPCDSQRREWGCPLAETTTSSLCTQATQFSSSIKWKQCPFSMGNGVRFSVRQRGTDYSVLHTCMSLGTQVHPQQCP